MTYDLVFIFNGFKHYYINNFETAQEAVDAMKEHIEINSAITKPRFHKSWSDDHMRIDYGAEDCYYLITPVEKKEEVKDGLDSNSVQSN